MVASRGECYIPALANPWDPPPVVHYAVTLPLCKVSLDDGPGKETEIQQFESFSFMNQLSTVYCPRQWVRLRGCAAD